MIDILIMDDSPAKVEALRQVMIPILSDGEIRVEEAANITDGRTLMMERQYDLLILDMVMPELLGQEQSRTAGSEYLDEIYTNGNIKTPLQVIGLTEYEEEFTRQQQEFRDRLWHLLFYSQTDTRWRRDLKQKVIQLHQFKKSLVDSIENRNKYDIGIICALSEEFSQMLKAFGRCHWEYLEYPQLPYALRTTTVTTASMHDVRIIAACADKPGVCATSVLATALYTTFKVDTVFMTGITAGFETEDANIEDIIIAESINDYAIGKLEENEDRPAEIRLLHEIQQLPADRTLISKMSEFLRDNDCEHASIAKTVCGPFVVSSNSLMNTLKKGDRKFKALDMEGFALYLAAHTLGKKALWIKSISDFGQGKDDTHHAAAASGSAKLLYDFIRESL